VFSVLQDSVGALIRWGGQNMASVDCLLSQ